MPNFRTLTGSGGWPLRKKPWPADPSRKSSYPIRDDGIRIEPLYDRSVTAEPLARANPGSPWIVSQRIDDPDIGRAKAQALEDVAQGATGLSLVFEGAPNAFGYGLPRTAEALETVLDGVPLNRIQVRIDAHPWSRAVADWLVAFLSKRRSDPAKLNLSFGIDPAAIFAGTGRLRMSIEALQASMPQSLAHFFSMGVPGRPAGGRRTRLPQCRRHRSAGTGHHDGFGGLLSPDV